MRNAVLLPARIVFLVTIGCTLAIAATGWSQNVERIPDVENLLERLEATERRLGRLESAPPVSLLPAIEQEGLRDGVQHRLTALEHAWGPDGEIKEEDGGSGKPTLKINGRIHLDYWNFADESPGIGFFEHPDPSPMLANFGSDPEDRLFFRRIRLKFEGDVFDNMLYRMQIDFNSPDSGEMKDMYIGFKNLPLLGTLLIGNQKRPLGLDHLNSSRFNVFIERPLVVEAFNEDARRFGIASYNVSDNEVYNWRSGVYSLENLTTDGEIIGDSIQLSANARLASSPWYTDGGRNYFHWAVAGMVAKPDGDVLPSDTNSNEGRFRTRAELRSSTRWLDTGRIAGADWYETLGLESILNLGPLQVTGEYQTNWMQRDNDTAGTGPDLNFQGGYVYIAYMLTGEHVPYKRKSGTIDRVIPYDDFFRVRSNHNGHCGVTGGRGAWQVAFRYSHLDLTDHDIQGGVENNYTLGLVWYINSHASFQFNAIYGEIDQHAPVGPAAYTDGHFTALGTRLRVDF